MVAQKEGLTAGLGKKSAILSLMLNRNGFYKSNVRAVG